MKSIRTDPSVHAPEGDERIRTAVPSLSADPAYESHGEHAPVSDRTTVALYHVPRSQVWEGSRGRQSGRVHLHVEGRALCGVRSPWYPREPMEGEQRCAHCVARAEREGIEWPRGAPS